ncbi:hypothetical protein FACS1894132_09370 [Clostridia bacterium]|nr:hypothetical protein FACS1894132_09370 [Clostridia bacterium]
MINLKNYLQSNVYPGRGIILGKSVNGDAVAAYFIMGRSENSRNRVFVENGNGIRTKAFDDSKVTDPSLIIYAPVRVLDNKLIVTNGDQTDTIYALMQDQLSFEQALRTREFEPDAPNYTPRISGIIKFADDSFNYAFNIIKTSDGNPESIERFTFAYKKPIAGQGRFLHTYSGDGNPLPSFKGEPVLTQIPDGIDDFTSLLWDNLNNDNKVSLFVRYIDKNRNATTRIINKNV